MLSTWKKIIVLFHITHQDKNDFSRNWLRKFFKIRQLSKHIKISYRTRHHKPLFNENIIPKTLFASLRNFEKINSGVKKVTMVKKLPRFIDNFVGLRNMNFLFFLRMVLQNILILSHNYTLSQQAYATIKIIFAVMQFKMN